MICVNSSHDSVRLLCEFPSRFSSFIVRTQHTNYLLLAGENSMRGFLKSYHTAGIIIYIRLKGRPSRRDVSRGLSRTFKNPNQIFFNILFYFFKKWIFPFFMTFISVLFVVCKWDKIDNYWDDSVHFRLSFLFIYIYIYNNIEYGGTGIYHPPVLP